MAMAKVSCGSDSDWPSLKSYILYVKSIANNSNEVDVTFYEAIKD